MRDLIEQIKKSIVFLGKINEKKEIQYYATGFLVDVQNVFHLVTAKHVVVDKNGNLIDNETLVFFNLKDGRIASRSIAEIKKNFAVNWIFHENKDVDIAIIPFGLDPQNDDVKTIPDNMYLPTDRLFELYDIFFLSYQPGIEPQKRISPVIRNGTVSLINEGGTFYIDGSAFPGNSGSPVFLKPSPIRFDDVGNISIGGDPLSGKFIGIISGYLPYQEVAVSTQTGHPRVIFEENTGLSKVWSCTYIREIAKSDIFKQQFDKVMKR